MPKSSYKNNMTVQNSMQSVVLLLVVSAIWGSTFAATKFAVMSLDPTFVTMGRISIGAITMLLVACSRSLSLPRSWQVWGKLIAMAILGNALPFFLLAQASLQAPSGDIATIMGAIPIVTMLIAHVTKSERLNKYRTLGICIGFIGVIFLITGGKMTLDTSRGFSGHFIVLAATIVFAMNIIIAKTLPSDLSPVITTLVTSSVSIILLLPVCFTILTTNPFYASKITPLLAVIYLGLFGTGIGYSLYYQLISIAGPTFASMNNYLVPVFGIIVGYTFLDEEITSQQIFAILAIIIGLSVSRYTTTSTKRNFIRSEAKEGSD
jgi:drug/metabolite transporter (DMT)-like permease